MVNFFFKTMKKSWSGEWEMCQPVKKIEDKMMLYWNKKRKKRRKLKEEKKVRKREENCNENDTEIRKKEKN